VCFLIQASEALSQVLLREVHENMEGKRKSDLRIGSRVKIVQKKDQDSGTLTEGVVQKILTGSERHPPHGIKVTLESGEVGRVKAVVEE